MSVRHGSVLYLVVCSLAVVALHHPHFTVMPAPGSLLRRVYNL
jgi:hypothetical protein